MRVPGRIQVFYYFLSLGAYALLLTLQALVYSWSALEVVGSAGTAVFIITFIYWWVLLGDD